MEIDEDTGLEVAGECVHCGETLVFVEGIPVHKDPDEDPDGIDYGWGHCPDGDHLGKLKEHKEPTDCMETMVKTMQNEIFDRELKKEDSEVIVDLAHGYTARSGSKKHECGEYVRICAPNGVEVFYWDKQEWANEPENIMGAIFGAMSRASN